MPFTDPHRVLKPHILRSDAKPTRLLLGEDHDSVLILRSLMKYSALLAAGAVMVTSIVLKDLPLIGMNLLLMLLLLAVQLYKLSVDAEERVQLILELFIILGAAGIVAWMAYPLLTSGTLTYFSVLIFANTIATAINIAVYVSPFLASFLVFCSENVLKWLKLARASSTTRHFTLSEETHPIPIAYIRLNYRIRADIQDQQLEIALNAAMGWLDNKRKRLQARLFSSEIYPSKIAYFKKLIRHIRKGDLNKLLLLLQRKRLSRLAKLTVLRKVKTEAERLFHALSRDSGNTDSPLEEINRFLQHNTYLTPLSAAELKPSRSQTDPVQKRKQALDQALEKADRYYADKCEELDTLVKQFINVGILEEKAVVASPYPMRGQT